MLVSFFIGMCIYLFVRFIVLGLYTVDQAERAVKTIFGRAQRLPGVTTLDDPISSTLNADERERYCYPQVRVIQPGGPYFKWPWEKIHKASIAVVTANMAYDPENPQANNSGTVLEAVTRDQLNIGLSGQLRYRVSERNLYAVLFGVKNPIVHTLGYFVSVLRERIANFKAPQPAPLVEAEAQAHEAAGSHGISINDLRKNLRDLNQLMADETISSQARYGIQLDASLITGIDPPAEVESALAAINTTLNNVSADISRAQAAADQTIVLSKRAVEIEGNKAEAEVAPLLSLAKELKALKDNGGPQALSAYVANVKLGLLSKAKRIIKEV